MVLYLENLHPPFTKGIVVVVDTDSVDIVAEDIVVVEIVLVDIEQVDIEVALIQLASAHHSSSSRYPSFSLAEVELLCNISHCFLLIYKIYSID